LRLASAQVFFLFNMYYINSQGMQNSDLEIVQSQFKTAAYHLQLLQKQAPGVNCNWPTPEWNKYHSDLRLAIANYKLLGKLVLINTQFELPL